MDKMIIIANCIALIASILMIVSGMQKTKNKIVLIAAGQMFCNILSNILVNGWPGAINNTIAFTRNMLCYKGKFNKKIKYILMVSAVIFIAMFNNVGLIGYLPILSSVLYTYILDTQDPFILKFVIGITLMCWLAYDLTVGLYVAAVFDSVAIVSNTVTLIIMKKKKALA